MSLNSSWDEFSFMDKKIVRIPVVTNFRLWVKKISLLYSPQGLTISNMSQNSGVFPWPERAEVAFSYFRDRKKPKSLPLNFGGKASNGISNGDAEQLPMYLARSCRV